MIGKGILLYIKVVSLTIFKFLMSLSLFRKQKRRLDIIAECRLKWPVPTKGCFYSSLDKVLERGKPNWVANMD